MMRVCMPAHDAMMSKGRLSWLSTFNGLFILYMGSPRNVGAQLLLQIYVSYVVCNSLSFYRDCHIVMSLPFSSPYKLYLICNSGPATFFLESFLVRRSWDNHYVVWYLQVPMP